jgi:formylglycine-generating enzyme required for sulfatase activity
MKKSTFLLLLFSLVLGRGLYANYITIQNASVTGATTTTAQIQYDMFWENSWRDAINWDAAWVFVKYNTGSGWNHCTLSATGHVSGTATPTPTINVPADNKGAFIFRSSISSGTYSITGQQLRWNFQADGLNQTQATTAQIRIFGIEMVYIPTGTFALGDGNGVTESSNSLWAGADNYAYGVSANMSPLMSADAAMINSTGAATSIRIHGTAGLDENGDQVVDNAFFPIGFTHFYTMKYEISQGQYAEFLNTLTTSQATARYYPTLQNRYTIAVNSNVYSAGRPDRACNYLSWVDGCAYSDWACLRPLSELEYEKFCRGPLAPVVNERPWGNNSTSFLTSDNPAFTTAENGTEVPANSVRYVHHPTNTINGGDGSMGPVRSGMFARSTTNARTTTGASYYGVMDAGDNLMETYVTIGNVNGRSFRGNHGDGNLFGTNGVANVDFWPGINGNTNANTVNTAFMGSTGLTDAPWMMPKSEVGCIFNCIYSVSGRPNNSWQGGTGRNYYWGFRCGRTAP